MSHPVALVTGASRGIGKRFASTSPAPATTSSVPLAPRRDRPGKLPGTIEETARLVGEEGRRALPVALDVRDEEAVAEACRSGLRRVGPLRPARQQRGPGPSQAGPRGFHQALASGRRRQRERPLLHGLLLRPAMIEAGGAGCVNISSGVCPDARVRAGRLHDHQGRSGGDDPRPRFRSLGKGGGELHPAGGYGVDRGLRGDASRGRAGARSRMPSSCPTRCCGLPSSPSTTPARCCPSRSCERWEWCDRSPWRSGSGLEEVGRRCPPPLRPDQRQSPSPSSSRSMSIL